MSPSNIRFKFESWKSELEKLGKMDPYSGQSLPDILFKILASKASKYLLCFENVFTWHCCGWEQISWRSLPQDQRSRSDIKCCGVRWVRNETMRVWSGTQPRGYNCEAERCFRSWQHGKLVTTLSSHTHNSVIFCIQTHQHRNCKWNSENLLSEKKVFA